MYTGTLTYIVKLPDEVCTSHKKRVGDNKKNYNLRRLQNILLDDLSFWKYSTMLEVVAFVLAMVCKRMQQLPTMLKPAVHLGKDTTHRAFLKT